VQEASPVATDASAGQPDKGGPEPVKVSVPQLAYAYKLSYLLPGDKVAAAQEAHRALCDRLGPTRCQMLALERGNGEDVHAKATLKLRVASAEARNFSDTLTRTVAQAGGRSVGANVTAEDVSKQIVDVQARIRQRELLVARLTEILRTRTGKVSELVEAERSVAQAQEELDQAKGWLAELQGRVAMSDFEISYSAVAATASTGSVGDQLSDAVSGSASGFLIGLRALLTLLIYLAPWALLAVPLALLFRRLPRRKRDSLPVPPPADA
jgi:phosphoribosylformylglycinamidine (FGAM) synthase PurS component